MGKAAVRLMNMTAPRQQGEVARLRVLGGPDFGSVFSLLGGRVSIGRGEENDIVLSDLKASRRHAELTMTAGGPVIRDLGSSHGIFVNGTAQQSAPLRSGDKIGIGATVFEFIGAEQGATRLMVVPPPRTAPAVGVGRSGLTQFIRRQDSGLRGGAPEMRPPEPPGLIERNRKAVMTIAVLLTLVALLPEAEHRYRRDKNPYADPQNSASLNLPALPPPAVDPASVKTAEQHFKEGFREYRAKNYLRALMSFETALQVYGEHSLARIYLESTKKAMEDEGQSHIEDALRDEEANRVKSARLHYEAVKRLFARDQGNPLFKKADSKLLELKKKEKEKEERK